MKLFSLTLILIIFSQLAHANETAKPISNQVKFTVVVDKAIKAVPVLIVYHQTFYSTAAQNLDRSEYRPITSKGNIYTFLLSNQSKPAYFSIAYSEHSGYSLFLEYYHFEPGDEVSIGIKPSDLADQFDLNFSGKQVAKYNCQNDFKDALRKESIRMRADTSNKDKLDNDNRIACCIKAEQEVIDRYKPGMSGFSCQLLRADIIGKFGTEMLQLVRGEYISHQKRGGNLAGSRSVADNYFERFKVLDITGIPDSVLLLSVAYADYKYQAIKVERLLTAYNGDKLTFLDHISKIENQDMRDKVTVITLIHSWKAVDKNYDKFVADALRITKNKQCLAKITEFTRNSVGQKAFNFSLQDMHGKTVTLTDFIGKVVFIDYYFTGCTNCKIYYKNILHGAETKYSQNKNIVFISISIDSDKMKWLNGIKSGDYNSPDGVNLYTGGEGTKNELIRYHNIIGYPTLMLVSKDGRIIKFADLDLRDEKKVYQEIDKAIAM